MHTPESACPGYDQDRVNFHRNPGRGTAGWADPTWSNGAGYSIPCAVMLDSGGGEMGGRNSLAAWERAVVRKRAALFCVLCSAVLFCVFPLSVLLLFLFPLFAVLLNCPYPDPPVSACFFPFSSAPGRGGGADMWCFFCQPQPNQIIKCGAQAWGGDNGRAEQRVFKQLS